MMAYRAQPHRSHSPRLWEGNTIFSHRYLFIFDVSFSYQNPIPVRRKKPFNAQQSFLCFRHSKAVEHSEQSLQLPQLVRASPASPTSEGCGTETPLEPFPAPRQDLAFQACLQSKVFEVKMELFHLQYIEQPLRFEHSKFSF